MVSVLCWFSATSNYARCLASSPWCSISFKDSSATLQAVFLVNDIPPSLDSSQPVAYWNLIPFTFLTGGASLSGRESRPVVDIQMGARTAVGGAEPMTFSLIPFAPLPLQNPEPRLPFLIENCLIVCLFLSAVERRCFMGSLLHNTGKSNLQPLEW